LFYISCYLLSFIMKFYTFLYSFLLFFLITSRPNRVFPDNFASFFEGTQK
jgi:hypothetical protein